MDSEQIAPRVGECVFTVAKKCYQCGKEWDGSSFVPQPANVERLPGICGDCIEQQEVRIRAFAARGCRPQASPVQKELPDLVPQRHAGLYDD